MPDLKEIGGVIAIVTAALGVLTALIAVITGTYQASLAPRMKRRLEWANAARTAEDNATRKLVLDAIVQDAHARLVASARVPASWFWPFPVLTVYVSIVWGALFIQEPSVLKLAAGSLVAGAFYVIPLARAIRLVKERQRIARCYIAGQEIGPLDVEKFGNWTERRLKESLLAAFLGVGLGAISGTVGWVIAAPSNTSVVALVVALLVGRSGVTLVRDYFGDPTINMP